MLARLALALLAACLALACGASPRTSATPHVAAVASSAAPHVETPCERSRAQRARVPGLLAKGKLDRTLRVLAKANELCKEEAPSTSADEVETLAEVEGDAS
jgi:hypothetical protein